VNPLDSPVYPSTLLGMVSLSNQSPGLAFRQTFRQTQGRECIERLKAPSIAEGLEVHPEPIFTLRLERRGLARSNG